VGSHSGTASDALEYHVGMQFSTKDRDNDKSLELSCAIHYHAAWWFNDCYRR
ncbi:hypothetical protein KR054_006262, partial [Drosophila jambulina]